MDDAAHIRSFLEGDPQVFTAVRSWVRGSFSPYRQRLHSELEDLEQDVLIALTEALRAGSFQGQSSLRTYVRAFTHHKCLDRLRALSRRHFVDVEDVELPPVAPVALSRLDRAERLDLTLRILEAMPEGCRELWQMLHDGLRYREMSRRLGVAEGTLRVRVRRCRQKALEARARLLGEETGGGR